MANPEFHVFAQGPAPVAPYSHIVEVDGWLFVTGQLATGSEGEALPPGIEAQTRKVMENLKVVLSGVGASLRDVVQARVFLTNFEADYERMNSVYESYFDHRRLPARTTVGVTHLARGGLVEVDFIARRS